MIAAYQLEERRAKIALSAGHITKSEFEEIAQRYRLATFVWPKFDRVTVVNALRYLAQDMHEAGVAVETVSALIGNACDYLNLAPMEREAIFKAETAETLEEMTAVP